MASRKRIVRRKTEPSVGEHAVVVLIALVVVVGVVLLVDEMAALIVTELHRQAASLRHG